MNILFEFENTISSYGTFRNQKQFEIYDSFKTQNTIVEQNNCLVKKLNALKTKLTTTEKELVSFKLDYFKFLKTKLDKLNKSPIKICKYDKLSK